MFNVRTPLRGDLAEWALARGFPLWDWSALPIAADAVLEALGEEARDQLLEHGRWLLLTQLQALCRPLWTIPKAEWHHAPAGRWSAGAVGKAIRAFCGPRGPIRPALFDQKARAILESLQARPAGARDLFRGARGQTHRELALVRDLLRSFLECAAYRPRHAEAA
jgi:hypothetical protein